MLYMMKFQLDEHLDQLEDWSKGTRAEIITAMKSLDKWGEKFQAMNKSYREFNTAVSKYPKTDLSEKV